MSVPENYILSFTRVHYLPVDNQQYIFELCQLATRFCVITVSPTLVKFAKITGHKPYMHRPNRPQVWARGALAHWKCYKMFCALLVTVKRLIIYASFYTFCRLLGGFAPDPHRGSTHDPRPLGDSSPYPPICPPLEKILRAPMVAQSTPETHLPKYRLPLRNHAAPDLRLQFFSERRSEQME